MRGGSDGRWKVGAEGVERMNLINVVVLSPDGFLVLQPAGSERLPGRPVCGRAKLRNIIPPPPPPAPCSQSDSFPPPSSGKSSLD